jgi:hypothetical protein
VDVVVSGEAAFTVLVSKDTTRGWRVEAIDVGDTGRRWLARVDSERQADQVAEAVRRLVAEGGDPHQAELASLLAIISTSDPRSR